jgi:Ca-activated chloride channel family protein
MKAPRRVVCLAALLACVIAAAAPPFARGKLSAESASIVAQEQKPTPANAPGQKSEKQESDKKEKQESDKKQKSGAQSFSVKLNVTVRDAQGHVLTEARQEDFQITEDGVPQQVTLFERREGSPLIGLVIDSSGSVRNVINSVVRLGQDIVVGSEPGSEIFVERFVDSDKITVIQEFTSDKRALIKALEDIFIEGGQTALTDAVYLAAEHLAQYKAGESPKRRRALVVVTDGEDRASYYKREQLYAKLRETGVQVFVVSTVRGADLKSKPEKAISYVNAMALESGGAAYILARGADLSPVVTELLSELNAPYLLGYTPSNQKRDGSARKVAVTVSKAPDAETRSALARSSYTAPAK